jgi:hypothetical protein
MGSILLVSRGVSLGLLIDIHNVVCSGEEKRNQKLEEERREYVIHEAADRASWLKSKMEHS